MPQTAAYLSLVQVARHLGCAAWQVRRVLRRGLLRPPPRVGTYHVFTAADLPRIEAALRRAGYRDVLPATAP